MSTPDPSPPPPVVPAITSRRTLLQQSMWFYYLTIVIGLFAIWVHNKLRSTALIGVFLLMAVACLALPVISSMTVSTFWRRLLFPRKLKTTREGKWYVVLVIAIGFSAINSGDNLLYLILAMMLSFIISSGMLSENVLKGITLTRLLPQNIFAGQEFQVLLKIRNVKKWLHSYSLLFEDPDFEKISPLPTTAYLFRLKPGEKRTVSYPARVDRRGRYQVANLEIGTQYPFNFFMKSMERSARAEFMVYPAVRPINPAYFEAGALENERQRHRSFYLQGQRDFHAVREFRGGDNPRLIHWRVSARQNKLMVKSFDQDDVTRVLVLFNNYIAKPDAAETYEQALSLATSLIQHFTTQGFAVDLIETSEPPPALRLTPAKTDPNVLYRRLAELRPAATPTAAPALDRLSPETVSNTQTVAITVEPDPQLEALVRQHRAGPHGRYLCLQDPAAQAVWGGE